MAIKFTFTKHKRQLFKDFVEQTASLFDNKTNVADWLNKNKTNTKTNTFIIIGTNIKNEAHYGEFFNSIDDVENYKRGRRAIKFYVFRNYKRIE